MNHGFGWIWVFTKTMKAMTVHVKTYAITTGVSSLRLTPTSTGFTWSPILTFAATVENQYTLAAVNRNFSVALRSAVVWATWQDMARSNPESWSSKPSFGLG